MEKSWAQVDEENERFFERSMTEAARNGSSADREFFEAGLAARRSVKEDGLMARRTENGDLRYSVQQGLRAACFAREDVAGSLILQRAILHRLDGLRKLAWLALGVLVYIAYRVS